MRPTRGPRRRASTMPTAAPSRSATQPKPDSTISRISASSFVVVHLLVSGRRHLCLEGAPERLERREILDGRRAHLHPCNLAPASSM